MTVTPRPTEPPALAGARVVVVGAARSGVALARFLLSRQAAVVLTDLRDASALGPEVEVASWYLKGIVIGITGTNGKSTTTALTAHLLSHAGLKATACGNIGT